jgi:hypothetical protein
MDLIDMNQCPDDNFKYILHIRDHFTRYSWAKPLMTKEPVVIAGILYEIFCQFGSPIILQSDNGREFTANIISNLVQLWPSLKLVNGRPRHPQSQGMVERGNSILEKKLGSWMEQHNTKNWTLGLNHVVFVMNNLVCRATNKTPFEMVFGMHPHCDNMLMEHIFGENNCMYEEDLPGNIQIDQVALENNEVSLINYFIFNLIYIYI